MKKKIIITASTIVLLTIVYFSFFNDSGSSELDITTQVVKKDFVSEVITSGEVQSTSLKKINGPTNLRKFKLRDVKIQDLIPEGTLVKKGDYVGRLDPSGVNEQIIDAKLNLETAISKFTQQQLDTTLTLKQERNAIKDLSFSNETLELELKQSIYEPPATIKKLEINLEKNKRDLKEKIENYNIKKRQAKAKMVEVSAEVSKNRKLLDNLNKLLEKFTIYSDSQGMLTYYREWDGTKKKVGSSISPWNPAIATLPDLTKMQSKTYANEVDIRKIKKGLKVNIGLDAFPDLQLPGTVIDVANVGEKKRGSDIKVFPILIKLEKTDSAVRPGMTTSNTIITYKEKDVLVLPIETIYSKDTISFVYKKTGFSFEKKQVILGEKNNSEVVIIDGIEENDLVYFNEPENADSKQIAMIKQ